LLSSHSSAATNESENETTNTETNKKELNLVMVTNNKGDVVQKKASLTHLFVALFFITDKQIQCVQQRIFVSVLS
jgi:hypothetical protein